MILLPIYYCFLYLFSFVFCHFFDNTKHFSHSHKALNWIESESKSRGGSCAYPWAHHCILIWCHLKPHSTHSFSLCPLLLISSFPAHLWESKRNGNKIINRTARTQFTEDTNVKRELETGSQKEEQTRLLDEWKRLRHIHKEKTKDEQTGSGVKTSGLEPTDIFPFSLKCDVTRSCKMNLNWLHPKKNLFNASHTDLVCSVWSLYHLFALFFSSLLPFPSVFVCTTKVSRASGKLWLARRGRERASGSKLLPSFRGRDTLRFKDRLSLHHANLLKIILDVFWDKPMH